MSLDAEIAHLNGVLDNLYWEKDDVEAELYRIEREIEDYEKELFALQAEQAELAKSAA